MTIYATRHARGLAKNGQSQRYTGDERQSLLMWTLRRLEPLELQALHVSRKAADAAAVPGSKPAKLAWPNKFRMSEIFNEMPPCELGGNEQLPEEGTKEWWNLRRNRMLAAKRVVEDFLRYQSYQPRASVQKGRFNWWREEKLVRMFKIIEMGVIEVDGVDTAAANLPAEGRPPMDRIFYDIWEARALSPQFAADAEALRYNPNKELSDRRIYELLQERNPTLYRGLLTNKMQRDNGMVAHCAKSAQGLVPLIVPAYYPENAWPGVAPTDEFWFGTDMYEDAWFIDSGTSDVTKMKLGKRGLAVRGGYNPPQANKLRNASYGQFPKVQWYSAEHKDFGVKMYIVRSGSSGGKKNAATWEDVGFWDAPGRISESVRQRIVDAEYFNRPAASMAAKARGGADFFKGPYDPKKYLTADGAPAQGLVGSEIAAMMIMAVLPDMKQHYVAQGEQQYAKLCRYYELRHGLPLGSIAYPFPIFMDNDRRHAHARITMSMWWHTRHPRGLALQRDTAAALEKRERQVQTLMELVRTRNPTVNGRKKTDIEIRAEVYAIMQTTPDPDPERQDAVKAYLAQRTSQLTEPDSAGFAPPMFGPLVDKTPDINSPAENCVGWLKGHLQDKVREWMVQRRMQAALDQAKTYVSALVEKVDMLNTEDGLLTCKASVLKAVARVRLLAARADEWLLVNQIQIRKERARNGKPGKRYIYVSTRMEKGRDGRWMAKGVFKG